MHVNSDEKIVVLDRKVYDSLLGLALVGAYETCRDDNLKIIRKHARKFNTALKQERAQEIKQSRQRLAQRIARAKRILRHCGETLILDSCGNLDTVRILGRSKTGPDYVRVVSTTQYLASPIDVPAASVNFSEEL